jgi:hypothetical protein
VIATRSARPLAVTALVVMAAGLGFYARELTFQAAGTANTGQPVQQIQGDGADRNDVARDRRGTKFQPLGGAVATVESMPVASDLPVVNISTALSMTTPIVVR